MFKNKKNNKKIIKLKIFNLLVKKIKNKWLI